MDYDSLHHSNKLYRFFMFHNYTICYHSLLARVYRTFLTLSFISISICMIPLCRSRLETGQKAILGLKQAC